MEKYVQARLPRPLAVQLLKLVKKCQLSQAVSRQTLRAFCTHYKVNPSAVDHFDVTDLVNTPQTWLVSTEYHRQRQTWVKEALPSQERLQQHSSTKRSLLRCGKCKKKPSRLLRNADTGRRRTDDRLCTLSTLWKTLDAVKTQQSMRTPGAACCPMGVPSDKTHQQ